MRLLSCVFRRRRRARRNDKSGMANRHKDEKTTGQNKSRYKFMKKLFLSILAVLALGWASAQTSTNEVVTKYNEAVAAMQAKDWGKALPLLEQVVDKGIDSEDNTVLNCVQTSKKYSPNCY